MKIRSARFLISAGMAMMIAGTALAEAPVRSKRPLPRPVVAVAAEASQQTTVVPVALAVSETAQAPDFLIKPRRRPGSGDVIASPSDVSPPAAAVLADATGAVLVLRPRHRPDSIVDQAADMAAQPATNAVAQAVAVSAPAAALAEPARKGLFGFLRPNHRPDDLQAKQAAAVRVAPGKQAVVSKKGSVCGVADIKGEKLASIAAKVKGCGVADPVRVNSIAGIRLSTPATINCETAKALKSWITKAVEPTYGKGKVVELQIAASYACRPRNNKKGAKVSEHGRGNAVDIGGLVFSNGKSVSVLKGYDKPMRKVHKAACGIFGTTLGPGSDGYHENHLHFDIARYRGGPYCR